MKSHVRKTEFLPFLSQCLAFGHKEAGTPCNHRGVPPRLGSRSASVSLRSSWWYSHRDLTKILLSCSRQSASDIAQLMAPWPSYMGLKPTAHRSRGPGTWDWPWGGRHWTSEVARLWLRSATSQVRSRTDLSVFPPLVSSCLHPGKEANYQPAMWVYFT